ncbi:DNA methyltransferase [Streptomyces sp. NBC_01808]|uniref:DNA methyltransferase n=1 Tax=Streptomyces sp. NBC_01808 TaxID=2975947 RepID=UPI002DDAEB26|nr:DNA methyltransferase [Streptomyces sp. NBC_01808]WSA38781.1 DNA methyltransferase [Streptomyces sp. NBC_01808]
MRSDTRQNAHLTYRANAGAGRHGWLRLTPAYSVSLVRRYAAEMPPGSVVTDPFSGTGTTPLAAAEHGLTGQSLDVNPFLIWLGKMKTAAYEPDHLRETRRALAPLVHRAEELLPEASELWQPELHNIGRWWARSALDALKAIRRALDVAAGALPPGGRDLLDVAFCRTLIASSNAAFNHQSMSFKEEQAGDDSALQVLDPDAARAVLETFRREAGTTLANAATPLPGTARVLYGDSRDMQPAAGRLTPCDLLLTSPPYVNRMSYIRELRPYMYWMRHLRRAEDAGRLDWQAIGGTWGAATSRVRAWRPPGPDAEGVPEPVAGELAGTQAAIRRDGGRNGPLLANYVGKYMHDMWGHFRAAYKNVRGGGRVVYVIGNSTFYGNQVPAQEWYAALLREVGFAGVEVEVIRKRNSNKALFEYAVSGGRA